MFWNFLEFSRIFQNFLEFSRIFQNFLEFFRILQNFLEFSRVFQKLCIKITLNIFFSLQSGFGYLTSMGFFSEVNLHIAFSRKLQLRTSLPKYLTENFTFRVKICADFMISGVFTPGANVAVPFPAGLPMGSTAWKKVRKRFLIVSFYRKFEKIS